jgi:hypothetical protein
MSRSTKANLPWIDAVGEEFASSIASRFSRPFIFRQSGPYNQKQSPDVAIYFSDPILHDIQASELGHKKDFRLGYFISRYHDKEEATYKICAGFDLTSPALCYKYFMPNLHSEIDQISELLSKWYNERSESSPRIILSQSPEGTVFGLHPEECVSGLTECLDSFYRQRKVKDFTWTNSAFSALVDMPEFAGAKEEELLHDTACVAEKALRVFEGVDFLYNLMFPREIGKSRVSNGQNRALKTAQPKRICSWNEHSHCNGTVQAAHIKPDHLGGLAEPNNLFWLCRFHHTLVDVYLKADLRTRTSSRSLTASITETAPHTPLGKGTPLEIWSKIADKSNWTLPLSPSSISHLFETNLRIVQ